MSAEARAKDLAIYRGGYEGIFVDRFAVHALAPLKGVGLMGCETLAYLLLGMAALKTGFLTGSWSDSHYRKAAAIGFGIGIPVYALLAWLLLRSDFSVPAILGLSMAATVPFRPVMVIATAALIILVDPQGRRPGRPDRRRWPGRLHQLSRHQPRHDGPLLRLWRRAVRDSRPRRAVAGRAGDVGADAALVEALARPISIRPVRMALALARARVGAADAAAYRRARRRVGARRRLCHPRFSPIGIPSFRWNDG